MVLLFLTSALEMLSYSLDTTYRYQDLTFQIITTLRFSLPGKGSLMSRRNRYGVSPELNWLLSTASEHHLSLLFSDNVWWLQR